MQLVNPAARSAAACCPYPIKRLVNDDIWESIDVLAPVSLDFGASFDERKK
jgi:hypothetical protein